MGVQSICIMSYFSAKNMARVAQSKPPSPYPPAKLLSARQPMKTNTHFRATRNTPASGSFGLQLSCKRMGFGTGTCRVALSLEDAFKTDEEKINQSASASAHIDGNIVRIKKLFSEIESRQTSISAYDTAWVAMIPCFKNPQIPQFPQCLSWIMDNQLSDGSWGLSDSPSVKDGLCNTLACIIALRTWNAGNENVEMGLRFIRENIGNMVSEDKHAPVGFDIIFTAMLETARSLCLELPYDSYPIQPMLMEREETLKRIAIDNLDEYNASMIYIIEGLPRIVDWNKVLRHQNKDGSLFHSPSATACALMHTKDLKCLEYLNSMLQNLGNGVPSVYPLNLFSSLSMVDRLERLGIARYFRHEIEQSLDHVYRCWTQNEITEGKSSASDIVNSSLCFRILRMHGYDVSPDVFFSYLKDEDFLPSLERSGQAVTAMLNLYKASQVMFPGERILEEAKSFSRDDLVKREANNTIHDQNAVLKDLPGEVKHALSMPWLASLERIEHRAYIEQYGVDDIWVGKTSYKIPCISNDLFLTFAKKDYNICQAMHQKEIQELEKWFAECKFSDLNFARQKLLYCYFSVAATLFSPEMSAARIVWTKNAVLTTVVDDFYDVGGSFEELQCFTDALGRWDQEGIHGFSQNSQILFSALYNTVNDIAQNACAFQGRDVSIHMRQIWYRLVSSMMKEACWAKTGCTPSLQEYMENGEPSIALEPIVLLPLYLIGPKLPEQIINHPEYSNTMQLVNIFGRLLNDIRTYEKEAKEGTLNCVTLYMKEHPQTSVEDAIAKFRKIVTDSSKKLLKRVLQPSVLPRDCKQLHWNMLRILQLFYLNTDGFSSPTEMLEHINAVIFKPIL